MRLKYLYLVKVGLVATGNLCIGAVGLRMCISNPLKLDITKTPPVPFQYIRIVSHASSLSLEDIWLQKGFKYGHRLCTTKR